MCTSSWVYLHLASSELIIAQSASSCTHIVIESLFLVVLAVVRGTLGPACSFNVGCGCCIIMSVQATLQRNNDLPVSLISGSFASSNITRHLQDLEKQIGQACVALNIPVPTNVSMQHGDGDKVFQELVSAAQRPTGALPETASLKVTIHTEPFQCKGFGL